MFTIQGEIAHRVADALQATLTPADEKALAEVPTHDMQALDLFHRGRSLAYSNDGNDNLAAIPVLQEAVRRDPTFAEAWAELTRALSLSIRQGSSRDTLSARQAMDRVRALAPGSTEADLAEGNYLYYARGDYAGALQAFQRLTGAQATTADVSFFTANVLRRLGRWDEAVSLFRKATELEPENARAFLELAYTDQVLRRFDAARAASEHATEVAPDNDAALTQQIDIALWGQGDSLRARALLPKLRQVARDARPDVIEAELAYIHRDRRALNLAAHADLPDNAFDEYFLEPGGPMDLWRARMAWALGDTARARTRSTGLEAALAKALPVLAQGGPPVPAGQDLFGITAGLHTVRGWVAALRLDPFFDSLRGRADFQALVGAG